jgi:hypothetical protein
VQKVRSGLPAPRSPSETLRRSSGTTLDILHVERPVAPITERTSGVEGITRLGRGPGSD